jgi:hypothetical protein
MVRVNKKSSPYMMIILQSTNIVKCMKHVFAGTKIEGILRQSADVEEVDRRVQEYEQGSK